MAWEIRELDPEMAAFHAITAEEEAATAIFHAVRRRRYPGAERLNQRNHAHKAATRPFFISVAKVLRTLPENGITTQLVLDENVTPPEFSVRVIRGSEAFTLVPPLHFTASVEERVHDFAEEIAELANATHAKSVERYIQALANRRNCLLYAAPNGLPQLEGDVQRGILSTRDWVFRHLILYLLIDRHRQHQLFVQQCLNAYLALLARVGNRSPEPKNRKPIGGEEDSSG